MKDAGDDSKQDSSLPHVFAVVVVEFDHDEGARVEFVYPENQKDKPNTEEIWRRLPSYALPDGIHQFDQDSVLFVLWPLESDAESLLPSHDQENWSHPITGVAFFRQVPIEKVSAPTQHKRKTLQKSICVLCHGMTPFYAKILQRVALFSHTFFDGSNFADLSLIPKLFTDLTEACQLITRVPLSVDNVAVDLGISYAWLMRKLKPESLVILFKAIMLGCQIHVFGQPSKLLTPVVLLIGSLAGALVDQRYLCVIPYCPLQDHHPLLEKYAVVEATETKARYRRSLIFGTSNQLHIAQPHEKTDVLVHLEENKVEIYRKERTPSILRLTRPDRRLAQFLERGKSAQGDIEPSDDWIRDQLLLYLKSVAYLSDFVRRTEDEKNKSTSTSPATSPRKVKSLLSDYNMEWVSGVTQRPFFDVDVIEAIPNLDKDAVAGPHHPFRSGDSPILGSSFPTMQLMQDRLVPVGTQVQRGLNFARSAFRTLLNAMESPRDEESPEREQRGVSAATSKLLEANEEKS